MAQKRGNKNYSNLKRGNKHTYAGGMRGQKAYRAEQMKLAGPTTPADMMGVRNVIGAENIVNKINPLVMLRRRY
jgi:hypothetical protein